MHNRFHPRDSKLRFVLFGLDWDLALPCCSVYQVQSSRWSTKVILMAHFGVDRIQVCLHYKLSQKRRGGGHPWHASTPGAPGVALDFEGTLHGEHFFSKSSEKRGIPTSIPGVLLNFQVNPQKGKQSIASELWFNVRSMHSRDTPFCVNLRR
jgi:hypothetical protein